MQRFELCFQSLPLVHPDPADIFFFSCAPNLSRSPVEEALSPAPSSSFRYSAGRGLNAGFIANDYRTIGWSSFPLSL